MSSEYEQFGYNGPEETEAVLKWAIDKYHPSIALACSFQNPVLVHMLSNIRPDARIFAIDTGRLDEETFECADAIEQKYDIKIEWYFPKEDAVASLVERSGQYGFRENVEVRHECCAVRKVEPFNRAVKDLGAWISGARKDQNESRGDLKMIEKDPAHDGIVKINPLINWTSRQVRDFIKENDVPYNKLLDQGYTSIGCAPCTRAITFGEHPRSGRWWWEEGEHKECGLNFRNWDI